MAQKSKFLKNILTTVSIASVIAGASSNAFARAYLGNADVTALSTSTGAGFREAGQAKDATGLQRAVENGALLLSSRDGTTTNVEQDGWYGTLNFYGFDTKLVVSGDGTKIKIIDEVDAPTNDMARTILMDPASVNPVFAIGARGVDSKGTYELAAGKKGSLDTEDVLTSMKVGAGSELTLTGDSKRTFSGTFDGAGGGTLIVDVPELTISGNNAFGIDATGAATAKLGTIKINDGKTLSSTVNVLAKDTLMLGGATGTEGGRMIVSDKNITVPNIVAENNNSGVIVFNGQSTVTTNKFGVDTGGKGSLKRVEINDTVNFTSSLTGAGADVQVEMAVDQLVLKGGGTNNPTAKFSFKSVLSGSHIIDESGQGTIEIAPNSGAATFLRMNNVQIGDQNKSLNRMNFTGDNILIIVGKENSTQYIDQIITQTANTGSVVIGGKNITLYTKGVGSQSEVLKAFNLVAWGLNNDNCSTVKFMSDEHISIYAATVNLSDISNSAFGQANNILELGNTTIQGDVITGKHDLGTLILGDKSVVTGKIGTAATGANAATAKLIHSLQIQGGESKVNGDSIFAQDGIKFINDTKATLTVGGAAAVAGSDALSKIEIAGSADVTLKLANPVRWTAVDPNIINFNNKSKSLVELPAGINISTLSVNSTAGNIGNGIVFSGGTDLTVAANQHIGTDDKNRVDIYLNLDQDKSLTVSSSKFFAGVKTLKNKEGEVVLKAAQNGKVYGLGEKGKRLAQVIFEESTINYGDIYADKSSIVDGKEVIFDSRTLDKGIFDTELTLGSTSANAQVKFTGKKIILSKNSKIIAGGSVTTPVNPTTPPGGGTPALDATRLSDVRATINSTTTFPEINSLTASDLKTKLKTFIDNVQGLTVTSDNTALSALSTSYNDAYTAATTAQTAAGTALNDANKLDNSVGDKPAQVVVAQKQKETADNLVNKLILAKGGLSFLSPAVPNPAPAPAPVTPNPANPPAVGAVVTWDADIIVVGSKEIGTETNPLSRVEHIGTGKTISLNDNKLFAKDIKFDNNNLEVIGKQGHLSGPLKMNGTIDLGNEKIGNDKILVLENPIAGTNSTFGDKTVIHTTVNTEDGTVGSIEIKSGNITVADLIDVQLDVIDNGSLNHIEYVWLKRDPNSTIKTSSNNDPNFHLSVLKPNAYLEWQIATDSKNNNNLAFIKTDHATIKAPQDVAAAGFNKDVQDNAGRLANPLNTGDALATINDVGKISDPKLRAKSIAKSQSVVSEGVTLAAARVVEQSFRHIENRMQDVRAIPWQNDVNASLIAVSSGDDYGTPDKVGVWGSPFYSQSHQKGRNGGYGYKAKSTGGIIGIDTMPNDNLVVGGAISIAKTDLKYKDLHAGDKTTIDSFMFSVYGVQELVRNFFVQGIMSVGTNRIKTRELQIVSDPSSSQTAVSKYDSMFFGGEVLLGYNTKVSDSILVTPMAGIRYSMFNDEAYKETGVGFRNRTINKKIASNVEGIIGARIFSSIMEVSGLKIMPEVHAFISHRLAGQSSKLAVKIDGMVEQFVNTSNNKPAKTFYNLGLGLNTKVGAVEYGAGYDAHLAKKYVGHQGTLKVRVNF